MTLDVLETVATFDLLDREVVVAGDWHGSRSWIDRAIPAAATTGAQTMLHLGDFGFWPRQSAGLLAVVDYWVAQSRRAREYPGLERILVTPGNHEDWADLDQLFASAPDQAIRVSESVWVLPRGFRFTIGDRSVLSFGGAASIDYAWRVLNRDWWTTELPTPEDVERAVAGGPADILLTHDVGAVHTPGVASIITGPTHWSPAERAYSALSSDLINQVLVATTPLLQMHGHFHTRDSIIYDRPGEAPLRVESLNMDGQAGNLVTLALSDLSVAEVDVSR